MKYGSAFDEGEDDTGVSHVDDVVFDDEVDGTAGGDEGALEPGIRVEAPGLEPVYFHRVKNLISDEI